MIYYEIVTVFQHNLNESLIREYLNVHISVAVTPRRAVSASTGKLEPAQSNNLLSNIIVYRSHAWGALYRLDLCAGCDRVNGN